MSINVQQSSNSQPAAEIAVCPECLRIRDPHHGGYFMNLQFVYYGLPGWPSVEVVCPECRAAATIRREGPGSSPGE